MKCVVLLIELVERINRLFCHHQWIYERRADGELGLRCMNCMKQTENSLSSLIRWRPEYPKPKAVSPGPKPEMTPPLSSARTATPRR